jgi:hypothetical protein
MSKYTEYRETAEKMKTVFETKIGDTPEKVTIHFNPINDSLNIELSDFLCDCEVKMEGRTGEALFKALKQIYE